jgi:hypothetical protein
MADTKKAMDLVSKYQDPPSNKMQGFDWRKLRDVQEDLGGMTEIPSHVEGFGAYMDEMARKAATTGLSPRELIKAYAITRSSIQRRSQSVDKLRESGLQLPQGATGSIRPEGAMAEWLKSPMGQRYLDAAEMGKVDQEAVEHAQNVMKPFGLYAERDALPWAANNLHDKHEVVSDMIKRAVSGNSPIAEWREFGKGLRGIGTAKAGFAASMLGRGDQPTLDARQVILQTGKPTSEASRPLARAGFDAVDRLAARQTALNPKMQSGLEPFRQHLTHHAIWDKTGNEETTHSDVIDAMRNAKDGGRIGYATGGSPDGERSNKDILAHAIAALGIKGDNLSNLNPNFVRALQAVSSPFSDDPKVVQNALSIAQGLNPSLALNKKLTGGFYNVKQNLQPDQVTTVLGNLPGVKTKAQNPISWDQFHQQAKGGTLINVGGDRTNLGRLTHINGKELNWPVDLHAGPKYMLEPNPGAVWANASGHTTLFNKKIQEASKKGDVYGVYSPMGAQSGDSAHHMFDALMAQINKGDISPKDAKEFDDALKSGMHAETPDDRSNFAKAMEGWPGILNPKEASEYARNLLGKHRSGVVKMMDRKSYVDKGFPKVGETRVAITDPDVLNMPGNMLGHRIVRFDPSKLSVEETAFKHGTYKTASAGEYVGDVPAVQRQYAMPDVMEGITGNPKFTEKGLIVHPYSEQSSGRSTARKFFEEQKNLQPINDRMNDSINIGLERQKKYGLKDGGKAKNIDRALALTSVYNRKHNRDA